MIISIMIVLNTLVVLLVAPSIFPGLPEKARYLSTFFIFMFAFFSLLPAIKARHDPKPEAVRKAVKGGIMALVPLNATFACLFGAWWMGPAVMLQLPLSLFLARKFAVT